jgi:hypothetical protein
VGKVNTLRTLTRLRLGTAHSKAFWIGVDAEQGNLARSTELTVKNMHFSTVSTGFATYGVNFLNTSYSNVENCVFAGSEYGISDGNTGGNNHYVNNTFNKISYMLLIAAGSQSTVTVEQCETTVP